eukprot:TRINITY_DN55558_c0_g1_i1.p1 TRINITY_DN55558_c0_g1~~TRINITY_DN55558_c0_g1_i1.p1  ORF type:complete len:272 (-),score=85.00 TRINITY_DN55558_c0_g1_i1:255-1070(-)
MEKLEDDIAERAREEGPRTWVKPSSPTTGKRKSKGGNTAGSQIGSKIADPPSSRETAHAARVFIQEKEEADCAKKALRKESTEAEVARSVASIELGEAEQAKAELAAAKAEYQRLKESGADCRQAAAAVARLESAYQKEADEADVAELRAEKEEWEAVAARRVYEKEQREADQAQAEAEKQGVNCEPHPDTEKEHALDDIDAWVGRHGGMVGWHQYVNKRQEVMGIEPPESGASHHMTESRAMDPMEAHQALVMEQKMLERQSQKESWFGR